MIKEKIKWNEKYKSITPKPPSKLLKYIPKNNGTALDLAGGYGRNATYLADLGYIVKLIDISEVAISMIKDKRIKTVCADLDEYEIDKSYDVVLMIKYHNLNLLKQIPAHIKKNGFFIFETIDKYPVVQKEFFEIFKGFKTLYFTNKPFGYVGQKC